MLGRQLEGKRKMPPRNYTGREVVAVGFSLGSMASQAWGVARLVVRVNSLLLADLILIR